FWTPITPLTGSFLHADPQVSPSCAVKLAQRMATTGSAVPARQGRPPGDGKLAPHMATLVKRVDAEPDIAMPELSARLASATGVEAHPASLSRVLLKAGYSFKKTLLAMECGRDDVAHPLVPASSTYQLCLVAFLSCPPPLADLSNGI
ncbi:MAG: hypothetical protein V4512_13765, partial [Pseudomonadota bacterium]